MYNLRQFRPTLYLVLIIGVTGFALAAEAPLIWVLGLAAIALNAWLVRSNRFTPLPRWLANTITVTALVFVSQQILLGHAGGQPLILIGQFLVLLQIVKLFECRANRDYAQMLVLSLLLMVAGSINATSLLFAVILMVYLVIALYCCLLFHLKVETERAKSNFAIPEEKISPATLRQDQTFLPRSMRRFTAFVAFVAITMAVVTFLFFPRGSGAGVLGNFQLRSRDAMTGFSENVGFEDVYNIQQNTTPLARVVLSRGAYNPRTFESNNEKRVEGGTLLLRGLTYNTYGLKGIRKWDHTFSANLVGIESTPQGSPFLLYSNTPRGTEMWHQRINLDPTGGRTIFAMGGPVALRVLSSHEPRIGFSSADDALQGFTQSDTQQSIDYEVWSTNRLHSTSGNEVLLPAYQTNRDFSTIRQTILEIEKFTRNPAIIGAENVDRSKAEEILPSNRDIARRIELYLQRNYGYTLDLSSNKEMRAAMDGGEDPVLTFLTKAKKGHCEYFASAMTLMCQSIGIPARMVIGFKCDDYNAMGGYFIVRQSHAHAWCEVLTGDGWLTFDPTSGRIAESSSKQSWWQATKHFFDFLEYKWGENVIAYDHASRESTINNIDNRMMRAAGDSAAFLHGAKSSLQRLRDSLAMDFPILSLSTIVVSAGLCFITFRTARAIHHRRLRHRAARIGIAGLSPKEQLRLAEQLAFYDDLITALARRNFIRPNHLTPMEFTDHLLLPRQEYEVVRRLTRLFYRIRYGTVALTPQRMRRLEQVVEHLEASID